MFSDIIISQCSPTMAGLKTGSLFGCAADRQTLINAIRGFNGRFAVRGVRMLPLGYQKNRTLVYMYRPGRLKNDLTDSTAAKILKERSYPVENAQKCVAQLAARLKDSDEFPHEIGLFLGYPPGDVKGFIDNRARHAKCVGAWKVYGDVEQAQKKFRQFDKCKKVYRDCFLRYRSIDRLIVADKI